MPVGFKAWPDQWVGHAVVEEDEATVIVRNWMTRNDKIILPSLEFYTLVVMVMSGDFRFDWQLSKCLREFKEYKKKYWVKRLEERITDAIEAEILTAIGHPSTGDAGEPAEAGADAGSG